MFDYISSPLMLHCCNILNEAVSLSSIISKNNVLNLGFGGQVDFIRGAAEALDGEGKPIIALPSVTNKGESKISPLIKHGKVLHCKAFESLS
jgi:acyl-CoA hydrolase